MNGEGRLAALHCLDAGFKHPEQPSIGGRQHRALMFDQIGEAVGRHPDPACLPAAVQTRFRQRPDPPVRYNQARDAGTNLADAFQLVSPQLKKPGAGADPHAISEDRHGVERDFRTHTLAGLLPVNRIGNRTVGATDPQKQRQQQQVPRGGLTQANWRTRKEGKLHDAMQCIQPSRPPSPQCCFSRSRRNVSRIRPVRRSGIAQDRVSFEIERHTTS